MSGFPKGKSLYDGGYDDLTFLMLSSAYGSDSYRPGNVVYYFRPDRMKYSICNDERFKHMMLIRTFPKGKEIKDIGDKYYGCLFSYDDSFSLFPEFDYKYRSSLGEGFKCLQEYSYVLPYLSRMSLGSKAFQEDGLGKSAKELYELAQQTEDDVHKLFFLSRSSLWGNIDATMELMNHYSNQYKEGMSNTRAKKLWEEAKNFCLTIKGIDEYKTMLPLIDKCYETFSENYDIASKNVEKEEKKRAHELAVKEAKRERRRRMWGNILAGVAQATAATMNQMYGGGYAMSAPSYSVPSYSGGVAAQMSQPGYYNNVYNQLMLQSMSQIQQQQWNNYQNAQSYFQKWEPILLLRNISKV